MDWKECGRKQLWYDLRYCSCILSGGIEENNNKKTFVRADT
jgi:hypothetical protein